MPSKMVVLLVSTMYLMEYVVAVLVRNVVSHLLRVITELICSTTLLILRTQHVQEVQKRLYIYWQKMS